MSTVAIRAIDDTACQAHLRPARTTVLADTAPGVEVIHGALPHAGLRLAHARSHCGDHATRFMSSNDRLCATTNADGGCSPLGTVRVQITPAHARGFDFEDHLTGPGCWVREVSQFQASLSKEYHAAHNSSSHDQSPPSRQAP